jgi:outer membrane protein assembly factor BamA
MKRPCIATSSLCGIADDSTISASSGSRASKVGFIRFVVVERPVVRSIKYEGNKSITLSEILDRYKERKVGLVVESQYDPNKVQHAKNVLIEMEAERGHQYAKVDAELRRVPPSSLELTFKVDEGPKVKVGVIDIEGNNAFSSKDVIRAMKNLHPLGIPYSILFENLFAGRTIPPSWRKTSSAFRFSIRSTDISWLT